MREDESELNSATPDGAEQPGSWTTNGSAPPATASDAGPEAPDDDGVAFLADLARAMQSAAGAEHIRVSEDTERRRQAHLEGIRARETSEADQLRELAEDGVKGIDGWADAEIERIQRERERRILSRRRDLETSLEDHRALVAREVDAVEAAIVAYRSEIEVYFGRLDAESDPVAIASQAGSRPAFPALDAIGPEDAPAEAVAPGSDAASDDGPTASSGESDAPSASTASDQGAEMVGVMGSGPTDGQEPGDAAPVEPLVGADAAEAATAEVGVTAEVGAAAGSADQGVERAPGSDQPSETTAQANAVMPRSSGALLQAVPSLRPMASWFRRDGNQPNRP